jgi:hypothetical protein
MNTALKKTAAALALIAASAAVHAQTANSAPSIPSRTETPYQAAENKWLSAERTQESGNVAPIPFPVPDSTPAPSRSAGDFTRETSRQAAENRWLELERARGSGNVAPVPFPPVTETAGSFAIHGR